MSDYDPAVYRFRPLTLSILNRAWYWGTTALRGSVKIRTSVSSSRLCRGTTTGRRPTNSGIIPNSIRSLASTCFSSRSFSSISATVSVSPLLLAKSAAAAARRPFPKLEGVPKPKYYRKMKGEHQVRSKAAIVAEHLLMANTQELLHVPFHSSVC